ncbi:MAG: hypothetical protein QOK37_1940 [Thermoanaerobaculia bacterium]|jgi:hypothetical protein|nr:hypothetical protein [Thermoanaerobaculia bacterium]
MMERFRIARAVGTLLLLSLAVSTLPRLLLLAREAVDLLPLAYEARRERQMGPWYTSIQSLRSSLPKKESVALIAAPRDTEAGVFANYYLYPIRTRLFSGRNAFRNAAPDPTRPNAIVAVTAGHAVVTTYDALRDRDLRSGQRVVTAPKLSEPLLSFVLPIAASIEGPAPETFVIEATLTDARTNLTAPDGSAPHPNKILVTLWPENDSREVQLAPGETVTYYDLVHQLFGAMESGWIRIDSSHPLRAAFYFVNRGRGDATLLPNAQGVATQITAAPLFRDSKLFLLNTGEAPVMTTVGAESIPILPHAIVSKPITSIPSVHGNVYAFITTRELNGKTDFLWPQP